jgi:hypothetical protein
VVIRLTGPAGGCHPETAHGNLAEVLIEIIDTPAADAVPAADAILARLDLAGSTTERLLHGEEESCWPLVAYAGLLGLPTRIGLEDTMTLPDGTRAGRQRRARPASATTLEHSPVAGWLSLREGAQGFGGLGAGQTGACDDEDGHPNLLLWAGPRASFPQSTQHSGINRSGRSLCRSSREWRVSQVRWVAFAAYAESHP